ncbi:MAG TPA: AMP-binding protein [Acidimicrobiales bacterium]|nr:AMP-binding protein [Acidimicrobiales bacterium]
MTLMMLLEMVVAALGDRRAVGTGPRAVTYEELHRRAGVGAALLRRLGARHLAYVGTSTDALPVALFAAAWAGVPLLPLNYRLSGEQLRDLVGRHDDVLVIATEDARARVEGLGMRVMSTTEWEQACAEPATVEPSATTGEDVAVLLYTSGTTSEPKAVVLRHRHVSSYVISSVEFASAAEDEATLVSVPPYHIAGVATIMSNVYAGRRIVYLPSFSPESWLDLVREEHVTHTMVVPTMLSRIVDHLGEGTPSATPSLRTLAYGGARMPVSVLARALEAFGDGTDFVNAYGLTETSSTIAVLGPEDHRAAFTSDDPSGLARLSSVGRLVPGVDVEIRDPSGAALPEGEVGEIWVRGDQVSGEYLGTGTALDPDGWFPTRDRGSVDAEGYLFIEGRSDDTIIRGGENIAPAEIEDVLLEHPDVQHVAVVGVPDEEWGQRIAAAVVLRPGAELTEDQLREWARARLRTSKTPDTIAFRAELPVTETGKLLRRRVLEDLAPTASA